MMSALTQRTNETEYLGRASEGTTSWTHLARLSCLASRCRGKILLRSSKGLFSQHVSEASSSAQAMENMQLRCANIVMSQHQIILSDAMIDYSKPILTSLPTQACWSSALTSSHSMFTVQLLRFHLHVMELRVVLFEAISAFLHRFVSLGFCSCSWYDTMMLEQLPEKIH